MSPAEFVHVQAELSATKKKLERYTDLIAKLYDELDSLRNTIASCEMCKKKALKYTAAPAASGSHRSRSPVPLWRRVIRSAGRKGHSHVTNPLLVPPIAAAPKLIHPQPSTEKAVASNYTLTKPLAVDDLGNSPELEPDWSVEYNPDIQQTLDIQLAETISCGSGVFSVKFSQSGKYLAVGLVNGKTHIYDLKTLSKSVLAEYTVKPSAKSTVRSIQFSPDDMYIAIGLSDGRIQIWNVAQKRVRAALKGHNGPVFSIDFSPDGRFLVSASWADTIRIWRTRDGSSTELSDFAFCHNSVAFSPLGRHIFCGSDECFLRIWDTRSDKLVVMWTGDATTAWCVALSKDGKVLVSGGGNNILKYWDVSSYTDLEINVEEHPEKENLRFEVEGHTSYISSIALSSDTRWVFSAGGDDSSIRIWDAKTAALHCSLRGHSEGIMAVDASPTSQLLASAGGRRVRLWEFNVTQPSPTNSGG